MGWLVTYTEHENENSEPENGDSPLLVSLSWKSDTYSTSNWKNWSSRMSLKIGDRLETSGRGLFECCFYLVGLGMNIKSRIMLKSLRPWVTPWE